MSSMLSGKRMMVLGGIGVVALAAMSVMMMQSTDAPDDAHASRGAERVASRQATDTARKSATDADAGTERRSGVSPPADTSPIVPAVAQEDVFQRREYTYRSLGRKDPFENLVAGSLSDNRFFGDQIDPQMMQLVGILRKDNEHRALVEDARGFGYVMRKGDPVLHGRVIAVGPDFMKIRHSVFGMTETLTLTLKSKEQGGSPNGKIR